MELGLPEEFSEFLKLLKIRNVRYLLVGGWLTSILGYVRPTEDMDIWISDDEDNISRLKLVLREFAFNEKSVEGINLSGGNKLVRFGVAPLRIDIITSISGLDFADAETRKVTMTIDSLTVDCLSREDYYINKSTSGRLKDLADLERLPPL